MVVSMARNKQKNIPATLFHFQNTFCATEGATLKYNEEFSHGTLHNRYH